MIEPHSAAPSGLDFTAHVRNICAHMVGSLPALSHVDLSRVAFSFSQVRTPVNHGVQATLTPLRFEDGAETTLRGGRRYKAQRVFDASGREMLYILSCYLPRFCNHSLEEKVATILHELWHINPRFDGDLRRFGGRCYAHGPSQKEYDRQVEELARAWWRVEPPASLYEFLRYDFAALKRRYGQIYGFKLRHPKLIRV